MEIPQGWIGVDFDGTLAESIPRTDPYTLGPPIPSMILRVRQWLSDGYEVKLMTARMCAYSYTREQTRDLVLMEKMLRAWCLEYVGQELECTNAKDGRMLVLWDDRAIGVIKDTGERLDSVSASSTCPICGITTPHNHIIRKGEWHFPKLKQTVVAKQSSIQTAVEGNTQSTEPTSVENTGCQ